MSMSIEVRRPIPRAVMIVLSGEIDYDSAQDIRHSISMALAAGDIDVIDVDVAGVTVIDSTGVGTLVVARRICREYGVELHMCNPSPPVTRQVASLGAARVLGIPPAMTPAAPPAAMAATQQPVVPQQPGLPRLPVPTTTVVPPPGPGRRRAAPPRIGTPGGELS